MKDFKDDIEAAELLLAFIDDTFDCVVGVFPNAVKISLKISKQLGVPLIEYWGDNDFTFFQQYKTVLVVDDGVETGRKALEVAKCLGSTIEKHLAVPVCSKEIESTLLGEYVKVFAVKRPFVRRSLDWHYEIRPQYSIDEARLILNSALD